MKKDSLQPCLILEQKETNLFAGDYYDVGTRAIFGGHVLAQAVLAAYHTVPEDRFIHSLHGYFLLPGDPEEKIDYRVDVVRDGGSFSTRRVSALQHGKEIFIMASSFQRHEDGYEHQDAAPDFLPPEEVQSFDEIKKNLMGFLPESVKKFLSYEFPFEFKPIDLANPMLPGKYAPHRRIWFKYRENTELTRAQQDALMVYVSDYNLLSTAILPHEKATMSNTIMASIDHSMWFFRPYDVREWNLYSLRSPSAISARGFTSGAVYNIHGEYIARVAQEGLIRAKK